MTHEQIEYRNYMMQAMAAMWHSTMQFMSVGYSWKSNHKIFRQQKRAARQQPLPKLCLLNGQHINYTIDRG